MLILSFFLVTVLSTVVVEAAEVEESKTESTTKWRREMNEFCARLPMDPHCPLLHTLNDLFAGTTVKPLFTKVNKPILESFCAAEVKHEDVSQILQALKSAGGQVKVQKHAFCALYHQHKKSTTKTVDWMDGFMNLFVADVKCSSLTGYYGTDTAEYLGEFLDAVFLLPKRDVGPDVKYRLKRADWFLREARKVIAPGPIQKDAQGDGRWLILPTLLLLLFFLGNSFLLKKKRAES